MPAYSAYLRNLLLATVASGAVVGAVNLLIDPYGIFGSPAVDGLNQLKPASAERTRVVKPYFSDRMHAAAVIGGNSRPELGLDPESDCWPARLQPVFNAGIPGASIRTQSLYAMHASGDRTKRILQGVDFLDFIRRKSAGKPESAPLPPRTADESRLRIPGLMPADAAYWLQRTKDRLTALFSLSALGDSIYTVAAQRNKNASTRTPSGFNPARDYLDIIRTEGQHVLFAQKNRELRRGLQQAYVVEADDGSPGSGFTALRTLIAWSRQRDIKVTLFINPYHADYLANIEASGNWPVFETWKTMLTAMAAQEDVDLWDFNTVDAYTTESPPSAGNRENMLQWFWEPAHYRSTLGELMLATMLDQPCTDAHAKARFGVRLTRTTLEADLMQLREHLREYRSRD
ncbi:hypothetical protein J5J83_20920 [Azoarcus sp. L1K30]|uniref:hypothetical protein n=1 Tax=Azoarcus sp. L1K30 TaxID=2820277 RepID=UPI001B81ABF8|nr:hypothetical protein [Azoarcus sp. L1K30]MBR0568595.1 hypothetical protein [Azoarcus sp. L1K30]